MDLKYAVVPFGPAGINWENAETFATPEAARFRGARMAESVDEFTGYHVLVPIEVPAPEAAEAKEASSPVKPDTASLSEEAPPVHTAEGAAPTAGDATSAPGSATPEGWTTLDEAP